MEAIFINAKDVNVCAYKVYAKNSDPYAYADAAFTMKISSDELHDAFIKGMVIVGQDGAEYLPVSCKVSGSVTTITYATTDTSAATTAKLATVKSE